MVSSNRSGQLAENRSTSGLYSPFQMCIRDRYAIRGAVYIITNQQAIKVRDGSAAFDFIGNGNVFGVLPVPAILDVYKRQPEYRARY